MSNSIFSTKKPVAHNGRNGFDGSFSRCLVMRPSVTRGVAYIHTVPNSAYRINVADIVRTSPLQTAAFLRGKQELDFFFVPYSQLYSKSNDVILVRGEDHSASTITLDDDYFPKFPLCRLIEHAFMPYLILRSIDFYIECLTKYITSHPQATDIQFSNLKVLIGSILQACDINPSGLSTLHFSYSFPIEPDYSVSNPSAYLEQVISVRNSVSFIGGDVFQLLSTAGYGDYYSISKEVCDAILIVPNSISSFQELNRAWSSLVGGCLDTFDTGILKVIDADFDSSTTSYSVAVNLLNLMAYQKVWRDVYRDSVNDDSLIYLYASNMDYDLSNCNHVFTRGSSNNYEPILTFLRPRLRMMRKDLSTGLFSSSAFGGDSDITSYFNSKFDDHGIDHGDFSAYAIKYAMQLQKYRESLLRAGSRTKDLLKAEFGVESHYITDTYVRHIGSFDGALDINRVNATAESGSYSPGDIAGNVFSSLQGNTIDFTCNDHGIIIGVFSFLTDPMHNAFGVDPFNFKFENLDFFHEAFENMGLQPVSSQLFSLLSFDAQTHQLVSTPKTLGYCARYNEYKQHIDTVHDTFVTANYFPHVGFHGAYSKNGVNSNYVVVRDITQTMSDIKDRSYLLPSCMDTIFKSRDNGLPEYAHFDCALQFNISMILPMSTLGIM